MQFAQKHVWLATTLAGFVVGSAALAGDAPPAPNKPAALPVATLHRDTPVDFEKEVLPVLKNNCLACHNTTKAKAALNLETPQSILKGGDTGPAVVPGKSAESLVFKAAAHLDPELIMPPRDNKANASNLTPDQLALFKLWIDQGAKGEVHASATVHWLDHPPDLDPIFAVALTQDGQFAACGRGNRIDVYHLPSGQLAARLIDPKLGGTGLDHAAHRDLVNALAFNPEGNLLASAGYGEVKLWRHSRNVKKPLPAPALTNIAALFAVSANRRWLAAPTADHAIALYELASGRLQQTLVGHSNVVTSLQFSPDNERLCSGSEDQTVRVWSINDGSLIASASTPGEVRSVAWLSDGRQFASGGSDWIIRLWQIVDSAHSITLARELDGPVGPITALAALPGGKQLLSGGADGVVRIWSLEDGEVVRELPFEGAVTAVAVRPDGSRFAAAGSDGIANLWDAEGKSVAQLKGDRYASEQIAETERARIVARGDVDFGKKSLETAEGEQKKQTERVAKATETNLVTGKVFAEKEKALKDAETAKADADKGLADLLAEIDKVTKSFESADKASREGPGKAKVASEKAVQAQLAAERATLSKIEAAKIAADAASVAARTQAAIDNAGAAKETARRIAEESAAVAEKSKGFAEAVRADAEMKNKLAAEAKVTAEKTIEEVAALAFAAGQLKPGYDKTLTEAPEKRKQATNRVESTTKTVASAGQEFKTAQTRKSVTGHELELAQGAQKRAEEKLATTKAALAVAEKASKATENALEGAKKLAAAAQLPIRALAFSPDGLALTTAGDDGKVHTWSAETGAAFEVFQGGPARPGAVASGSGSLAFLDAQTVLATAGAPGLTAWDLNPPWVLERTLGTGDNESLLTERVNAVRFSPDGATLATGAGEPTRSGEIKWWNVADGKLLAEFKNVHSDAVLSLDFSPDGKHLASSSADRFVRVTELATGKVVKAFEGHTSYVLGVAWKRDSRTLASAGADNVIKVWDFVTGERKKNIEGATKEVTSIAFVGVTSEAIASSGDSQVRLLKENGDKVRSFEGASDFMNSAAATPDGQVVVGGGMDGVMRIWNGADGKLVASFAPLAGR